MMSKCDNCRVRKESAKAFDIHWHDESDCPYAKCPVPEFPKTNADCIRAMTDEELAEWVTYLHCPHYEDDDYLCDDCEKCWLDWLKEECDDNGT